MSDFGRAHPIDAPNIISAQKPGIKVDVGNNTVNNPALFWRYFVYCTLTK